MRTHVVLLAALTVLTVLPSESSAQRRPRTGRRPTGAQPAPLPPEMPAVARALAYRRSRWSVEGYPFVSLIQAPAVAGGGTTTETTAGTGTHGDFRLSDRFAATLDLTTSLPFTSTMTGSAEVGTRFRPMPWGEHVRPFFDLRVAYAYLYDTYAAPLEIFSPTNSGPTPSLANGGRSSRGAGGVVGTGLEYSLTQSLALTTQLSAMRGRMTTHQLTGGTNIPRPSESYWMTSVRYSLGLKFNPVRTLHLAQNPRS